jgi:hypothetical protein
MRAQVVAVLLLTVLAGSVAGMQMAGAKQVRVVVPDACAPIGRTEDGKLVYAMNCDKLPETAVSPTETTIAVPEPEARRSGLFGWSYDRR